MNMRCVAVGLLSGALLSAGCGTLHEPAEFSLGPPKKFETIELKSKVVRREEGEAQPAQAFMENDSEFAADMGILLLQGKFGPYEARHPIELGLYGGLAETAKGTDRPPLRGVCIVVPGMLGVHSADALASALVGDHWAIAVVWPPLADRALESMERSQGKPANERGEALARTVDSLLANAARVAQFALIKLHARYPELEGKPVLVVGESMGAMAGIGMVATGQLPFDAALFVAGGGDLIEVTRKSLLRGFLDRDGLLKDDRFAASYREICMLDPMRAASTLRGGPIAVITAGDDAVVPSETQEALWQALGAPPRFVWDAGHFELFWRSESTIVPVARRLADEVGGRSRAVDVLYKRVIEEMSQEEADALRKGAAAVQGPSAESAP